MSITLLIHQGESLSIRYWSELYWERKRAILRYSMIRKVRTVLYLHYILYIMCAHITGTIPWEHNTKNSKQIFPEKELRGLSPGFHIYVSVGDLYVYPMIGLPNLLQENMWTYPGNI